VIREAYLKAHAAVRHVHYGAEAALQLRSEKISPIEKIELAIYPEAVQYCGNRAPQTPIQAQFSLSFGLAAALRFGRLGSEAYRSPRFDDPELRRLEALVTIRPDERLGEGGRRAAVLNVDGLETRVDAVKGDPSMPFTADECRAKFLANGGTAAVAAAILDGPESAPFQPLALKMGKP
jgi:2-methylcitrate dehydratase PrpD